MIVKAADVGNFFKKYTMIIALVVVAILFFFLTNGAILIPQNINNLIAQNGYVFVLGTGMLLCILTGGNIDLSVGSVVCFAGAIGAMMLRADVSIWLAVLAMMGTGLVVGSFQGFFIAWKRVPAFIATLAGMYVFRGLSNTVLGGFAVDVNNATFLKLFGGGADCYVTDFIGPIRLGDLSLNGTCIVLGLVAALGFVGFTLWRIAVQKKMKIIAKTTGVYVRTSLITAAILWFTWQLASYKGIPTVLIWVGLVLGIYTYVTNKTAIGRYLYAIGGNEKATALSGVSTRKVFFFAYANIGLLAGLAGALNIARFVGAQPTYGQGYEMDAIAACFIGGASAYGGTGKISGVVIGATLMGLINQGMTLINLSVNYQPVVKGIVLLLAVMFDVLSKRENH